MSKKGWAYRTQFLDIDALDDTGSYHYFVAGRSLCGQYRRRRVERLREGCDRSAYNCGHCQAVLGVSKQTPIPDG